MYAKNFNNILVSKDIGKENNFLKHFVNFQMNFLCTSENWLIYFVRGFIIHKDL